MDIEIPDNGITLILGGSRSGKSSFAEKLARDSGKSVLFIATAQARDGEMAERIRRHKASRPSHWRTLELTRGIGAALTKPCEEVVLVDCITMLASNLLLALPENAGEETVRLALKEEIEGLTEAQARLGGQWLLVSNEVGLGLVPPYPLGRAYRDALGWTNQELARAAKRVIFMAAGLPLVLK